MIHICYVIWRFRSPTNFLNMGGAERQLLRMVNFLKRTQKVKVTILSKKTFSDPKEEKLSEEIIIRRIFTGEIPVISMFLFLFLLPLYIIYYHKKEFIDLIHLPLPDIFTIEIYFIKRLFKIPVIVRIAANELFPYSYHGLWLVVRIIIRSVILKMDAIHVLNHLAYYKALALGIQPSKVFLIPNGVEIPEVYRDYRKIEKKIVYIGAMRFFPSKQIIEQKNLVFLIESFFDLIDNISDLKLILVGDGNYRPYLEQIVRENPKAAGKIIFAGYQTEIIPYHLTSDIFINPSHFEGLPNTVIEAMASGLYVLCSNIPEHRFILGKNGIYGDLFDQTSKEDFIQKIFAFYVNPEKFIQKAQKARNLMKDNFSIEIILKRVLSMYQDVISSFEWLNSHSS